MAIFSNPFGKKKADEEALPMEGPPGPPGPPAPAGPPAGPARPPARRIAPTAEVRALSSRGVPEPDIIRTLRREGYGTAEIDQAMKEALRDRVSGVPDQYGERPLGGPPENMPSRDEIPDQFTHPGSGDMQEPAMRPPPFEPTPAPQTPEMPDIPSGEDFLKSPPRRPAPAPRQAGPTKAGMDRREMEELAEVIVDEKLRELREKFKSIDMQFQQVEKKMDMFLGEINALKTEKSGEVKGIEEKIDNYSRNMDEINGKMESLEKALKDSLVPMMESMRSLSELVKSMRGKKE